MSSDRLRDLDISKNVSEQWLIVSDLYLSFDSNLRYNTKELSAVGHTCRPVESIFSILRCVSRSVYSYLSRNNLTTTGVK